MQHVLTLDVGTTALKSAVFDRAGRMKAVHLEEYSLEQPRPDWVELDVEAYWQSALKSIRTVMSRSKVSPRDITSIGITSQGETLIVLDKDRRPVRKAIVWLDNRSRAEADAIATEFDVDKVYRRTGQQEIVPTWTATRILWLRRNEPKNFNKAHKFLLVADYLISRLTGRFMTDRGLNPSTLYYDITTGDWWPEMLQFLGIDRERLPNLTASGEILGGLTEEAARETGLNLGTPVTGAPIDQVAATVGAGNLEAGTVTECTGAAMAICATTDRPVYDPRKRVGLYVHAIPERYVFMPWAATAGMALRWFRDTFAQGMDYPALIEEATAIPPGADGLTMLPHLCGAFGAEPNSLIKGAFMGVTLSHRRGHLVRAVLESVACLLREYMEMLEQLNVPVREIRSIGGAARSDLWLQIKADLCGRDILVMDCEEAASLGTAMISFAGNGGFGSLEDARANMVRVRRRIAHNSEMTKRYDEVYQRYRAFDRAVKGA